MNTPNGLIAIQELFSFPFRDPQWKTKLLIGSGITLAGSIVPLIPLLPLLGYCARITRRAAAAEITQTRLQEFDAEGEPIGEAPIPAQALPEWDHWEELFIDGLRQLGVMLLINLPLLLLFIVGFGTYFGLQMTAIIAQANRANQGAFPVMLLLATGIMFLTMGISFLLAPVTYLFLPTASAHVAVTRRFGALFEVKRWFHVLRSNIGGYLAMLFFLGGLYMAFVLVIQFFYITIVCCFLLPVISSLIGFYVSILFFHASGLAYAGGSAS